MKNLSLILNVVLLVAVGVLFYLHFSTRNPSPAPVLTASPSSPGKAVASTTQYAYVNVDSLLRNYDYFKDAQDSLNGRRQQLEKEIAGRTRALENDVIAAQRQANTMTLEQAQLTEQTLRRKEQELIRYQNELGRQFAENEQKKNEELINNITKYLEKYTKDKPYKIVFGYSKGGGILYAADSFDITPEVLKGLNEEYQSNKPAPSAKKNKK